MSTSDVATFVLSKIKDRQLKTYDLLEIFKAEGTIYSISDLFGAAKDTKTYGIARDGVWYSCEDSVEINEAFNATQLPFNMEQFFRNRL